MLKSDQNYKERLSQKIIQEIQEVPHFKSSIYHDIDIEKTLLFFKRRYVDQFNRYFDIAQHSVMDCASGYGWFSFMYILSGGKSAIAVDSDKEKLAAAESIAKILSISSKMDFIHAPIEEIPVPDKSVDIFVCIETLEHVGKINIKIALESISRISKKAIVITTPNKLFPAIAHDTRIPFLHWFSPKYRKPISKIFGRLDKDDGNEFLSPFDLNVIRQNFVPVASCLTFKNFKEYKNSFPFYQPYGSQDSERWIERSSFFKGQYYRISSRLFKQNAYWIMPSLTNIFIQNGQ